MDKLDAKASPLSFRQSLWRLLRPYWTSSDKWWGYLLLGAIIALVLGSVAINVALNDWNGKFYNSIQEKNYPEFKSLLWTFTWLALAYIVVVVYQQYLTQMLQMRWRRWLTENYLGQWMHDAVHYRMSLVPDAPDNPDQRIADDFREFVDHSLNLLTGFINATVSLLSFIGVLWALSGPITLPDSLGGFTIPGYMVWIAIVYALVGSLLAHWIGSPLVGLTMRRQQVEADFRYSMVRARENTEAVAIYRGELKELGMFKQRFAAVVSNWWDIMKVQKRFSFYTNFYGQLAIIFPMMVGAPRYFAGTIQLGALMQISNAFGEVQRALSWFIDAYPRIASWKAAIQRLDELIDSIEAASALKADLSVSTSEQAVSVSELKIRLPKREGIAIALPGPLTIAPGQHTVINGPSGSGKSSLLRSLCGIWPLVSGKLDMPPAQECLFLSQRPYMPLGSLANLLSYPQALNTVDDKACLAALEAVGLGKLSARLQEVAPWAQQLSGGEQQRICIARALLQQPKWLFLDEATSALDEPMEASMYRLLLERLPNTTLISVAHRPAVASFHKQRLRLDTSTAPARFVLEGV